jgi:hypothetical protein
MDGVENLIPVALLTLFLVAVLGGTTVTLLMVRWRRKQVEEDGYISVRLKPIPPPISTVLLKRPTTWLAVRSRNAHAVQAALGLNNIQPCTWLEGLSTDEKLFIAPPIRGWVLIVGSRLPDPADDVDVCFRFLINLSRILGQVQFFKANSVLGHHAWMRVENGRVVRAYAWAGRTLWNQGASTRAELEFGMKCFQYFESPDRTFDLQDVVAANVEKVSLLASRWSLDPAAIDEHLFEHAYGIAGEPPRLY